MYSQKASQTDVSSYLHHTGFCSSWAPPSLLTFVLEALTPSPIDVAVSALAGRPFYCIRNRLTVMPMVPGPGVAWSLYPVEALGQEAHSYVVGLSLLDCTAQLQQCSGSQRGSDGQSLPRCPGRGLVAP